MTLHERIAQALGWTLADAQSFSLLALRDLVRPVDAKLAYEIHEALRTRLVRALEEGDAEYERERR